MQLHTNNDLKIKLIHSSLINTDLGLNYFNNNKTLYLKILHSFIQRYEELNLQNLNHEEFKYTLHTIKGLTMTLGMEVLSQNIKLLEEDIDPITLKLFKINLKKTIESIKYIL